MLFGAFFYRGTVSWGVVEALRAESFPLYEIEQGSVSPGEDGVVHLLAVIACDICCQVRGRKAKALNVYDAHVEYEAQCGDQRVASLCCASGWRGGQ
jgi:hypothetical protein